MTAAHVQLDYVDPTTVAAPRRRSIWWTILAVPTLVIPFVPFSCTQSPGGVLLDVVRKRPPLSAWDAEAVMICIMAACLCYGVLAFAWRVAGRWLARSDAARVAGLSVGAAGVMAALVLLAVFVDDADPGWGKWIGVATCVGPLAGAVWLLRVLRRRQRRDELVLGSLLAPFIAVGAMCLFVFWADRKLGWYLTLFSVPVSAVELVALAYAGDSRAAEKETAGLVRPAVVVSSSSS